MDVPKCIVTLPKVCDIYRKDFGPGEPFDCLAFILQYLEEEMQTVIIDMSNKETSSPSIKYHNSNDHFHSTLKLLEV